MTENNHTASRNVQILDTAFFIPQLNRTRRIWLYLPALYASSKKHFPVLYMHDGQNLFDAATSFSGEWEVDETLDASPNNCIVVGVDNGGLSRMNEYNPNDTAQFGKGEGRLYLEFIVQTLKPFIDKNYRTLRSRKFTFMAGSSMGGLISFYAGIFYPRIFGKLGIFSPAFWVTPQIANQIKLLVKPRTHSSQEYYFYGGGAENITMVSDMLQVAELMRNFAGATTAISIREEGQHSEDRWKKEFPAFYEWLFR
jgi:predicted alpha/beta superfamily hydrolase